MNKEKNKNQSATACCRISESESGKEMQCYSKCRRNAIFGLSGSCVMFISAFGFGYFIEPSVIKIIWLALMGAMVLMTGISIYILIMRKSKDPIDQVDNK